MLHSKIVKQLILAIADIVLVFLSLIIGLFVRFDGAIIPSDYMNLVLINGAMISLIFVIFFLFFDLYRSLWEYAGVRELLKIVFACMLAVLVSTAIEFIMPRRLPISLLIILCPLMMLFSAGTRITYRFIRRLLRGSLGGQKAPKSRVMIIGAGDACAILVREMMSNLKINSDPIVVVDDDKYKQGQRLMGIPVVGPTDTIPVNVNKYDINEIIFAIPSASMEARKRILEICVKTGCKLQVIKSQVMDIDREKFKGLLRPVNIEDLLGREQIQLDIPSIAGYLTGKVVLITGGGGSIGSEIARQVLQFKIKKLILLDIYENCLYDLYNELLREHGKDMSVEILIASIRDRDRLETIFSEYRPDIVFHAAAHKHVPLMEANPGEAIKNNVFGTLNVANMSDEYGVERFILISTDKAVNPSNIMGATKRIAEMLIQAMDKRSQTRFTAVRFGNVLGSNGSVIPLFKKQIESGGPVTITHPDIKRFFMTIPEASQLVIQAGALAEGGEIFVLDMGKQVKIMDLANNLILLSGLQPNKDIRIEVIGLRPGEKLYEELLHTDSEKTKNDRIFVEKPYAITYEQLQNEITQLLFCTDDYKQIRKAISRIIPGYTHYEVNYIDEKINYT